MSLVLSKAMEPARGLQIRNCGGLVPNTEIKKHWKTTTTKTTVATNDLQQIWPLVALEEMENGRFVRIKWHSVEFRRVWKLYKSFLYPLSCVSTRFFRMHASLRFLNLSDCTKEQAFSSTKITFGAYGLFGRSLIYHKIDNKHNIFIV